MIEEVKNYFDAHTKWSKELSKLRDIILENGLEECYKWRNPCYTYHGKNIVLLGVYKDFCLISFFKGELLDDLYKLLVKAGDNTRSAMYIPFYHPDEIKEKRQIIKNYIQQAIRLEQDGRKIDFSKSEPIDMPIELLEKFDTSIDFKRAFENLSPGRQRGYLLHFNDAKNSQTRKNRIEKYTERILKGRGILDCVCGLSKRMPTCDGSHKMLAEQVK